MGRDGRAAGGGGRVSAASDRLRGVARFFDMVLPEARPLRTAQVTGSAPCAGPEHHTPMTATFVDTPPQCLPPTGRVAGRAAAAA